MKPLCLNQLTNINGGWSWASFTDGACGVVAVADAGAGAVLLFTAATAVPNPLGAALVIGSIACAGWTAYRLST
ncbi:hypothetical protein SAMN05444359_10263 [Neolewinella agarilytica]|uniref:Uncharacterized protein n=1 Tax=Neolewinella agarilytica TaxID=478744 RepID=A0A1H9ADX3_9BACT|nr:hypothetical protein SAMN05444359_10263 [Neolewinella agarilytica]